MKIMNMTSSFLKKHVIWWVRECLSNRYLLWISYRVSIVIIPLDIIVMKVPTWISYLNGREQLVTSNYNSEVGQVNTEDWDGKQDAQITSSCGDQKFHSRFKRPTPSCTSLSPLLLCTENAPNQKKLSSWFTAVSSQLGQCIFHGICWLSSFLHNWIFSY